MKLPPAAQDALLDDSGHRSRQYNNTHSLSRLLSATSSEAPGGAPLGGLTSNLSLELSHLSAFDATCTFTYLSASGTGPLLATAPVEEPAPQELFDKTRWEAFPVLSRPVSRVMTPCRRNLSPCVTLKAQDLGREASGSRTPSTEVPSASQSARSREVSTSPPPGQNLHVAPQSRRCAPQEEDVLDQLKRTMRTLASSSRPRSSNSKETTPRRLADCVGAPTDDVVSPPSRAMTPRRVSGGSEMAIRSSRQLQGVGRSMTLCSRAPLTSR
mmetsp:Transcript_66175/g.158286  ORF Transcript_66175/g.158286 Transcript_66175/m.158286 type:complete len:270 (+) Transcript_66175:38-847(+)